MKVIDQVYTGSCAAEYDQRRANKERWRREAAIIEPILRAIPTGSSILDVAAGTGRWLGIYTERGLKPTLLDASADMLEIAKAKADAAGIPVSIVQQSAIGPESFPTGATWLIITNFLNWIPLSDVGGVLAKARRAKIAHAIIMITYLAPSLSVWGAFMTRAEVYANNLKSRLGFRDKGIFHLHTRDEVVALFSQVGFTVESETEIRTVGGRKNVLIKGQFL